jgi:hypothetical protein
VSFEGLCLELFYARCKPESGETSHRSIGRVEALGDEVGKVEMTAKKGGLCNTQDSELFVASAFPKMMLLIRLCDALQLFGAAKVLPLAIVANLSDSVGHDRERILGTQWIAFWSI